MKAIIIAVAIIFAATIFYGGFSGLRYLREVRKVVSLAKVNGKEVSPLKYGQTLSQILASIGKRTGLLERSYLQLIALNQVIDYTIMLQESEKRVGVRWNEVDQAISSMLEASNIPSEQIFEEYLKRQGITLRDYKKMVRSDMLVQKMIDKLKAQVEVKPEDLREIRARHILITPIATIEAEEAKADELAKKKAADLLEKIKKGADFSTLAKKHSDDPGSAGKGGDLGYFTTGTKVQEFEEAAFSLKPGEVSDIVKTDYGYHIIKLEDTRLRTVEQGKEKDFQAAILAEKQESSFMRWFSELKQKAKIEVTNPWLRAYDLQLKGKSDEALVIYNKMIVENPSDPYVHFFVGNIYEGKNELDLALEKYKKAVELGPGDPELHMTLGKAYQKAKMRKKAIEEFKKVSTIASDIKEIHEDLKRIYKDMGENTLAAAEEKIIERIEKREELEKAIQKRSK